MHCNDTSALTFTVQFLIPKDKEGWFCGDARTSGDHMC